MNQVAANRPGTAPAAHAQDRFGNLIDPTVSYARGTILRNNADEIIRQRHAYDIGRARCAALGPDSAYNLTGLIRGFRFKPEDLPRMHSYIHFGVQDHDTLVPLAIERLGGNGRARRRLSLQPRECGNPRHHDGDG